jgi:hypothetical protein
MALTDSFPQSCMAASGRKQKYAEASPRKVSTMGRLARRFGSGTGDVWNARHLREEAALPALIFGVDKTHVGQDFRHASTALEQGFRLYLRGTAVVAETTLQSTQYARSTQAIANRSMRKM